jgi:hypothetical protein
MLHSPWHAICEVLLQGAVLSLSAVRFAILDLLIMGALPYSIFIYCALCALALRSADAQANNTSPWEMVNGWQPEPSSTRGTMDIIWTCLVTIFACSWTVTHPSFSGTDRWKLRDSKIWSCVIAVLAPEFLAFTSFEDHYFIRHHTKAIQKMNKGPWEISQSFFIGMGGVQLKFKDCKETLGMDSDGDFLDIRALSNLRRALQLKLIDLNAVPAEDVRLRAKTNYIVKTFVCLQATWLVAQVIGRAMDHLPITTLEVVAVAYVVCALITYFCWWHKPQDAEVHITVDCRKITKDEFHRQIDYIHIDGKKHSWHVLALLAFIAMIFGAVHCTAWNFIFATYAESMIWKVASIFCTVVPATLLLGSQHVIIPSFEESWIASWSPLLIFMLYVLFRLYLMVEPFIAFSSVPVGIFYEVNWTSWIPHI